MIVGKCHAGKALMYNGGGQHDLDDVGRVMPLQQEFPAQIMNMLINIILENIIFQSIILISIIFGRHFHAFY